MPRPLTPVQRADILASLRLPGAKLAAVARQHGVSPSAVKSIRTVAGLNPLPTPEAKERAARARDSLLIEARRRRAALMVRSLEVAKRFLDALDQPAVVYAFGRNKAGVHGYVAHKVRRPDLKAMQAAMISYGIAIDKSLQLERYDQESTTASKAAIIELVDRLGVPQPGDEDEGGAAPAAVNA